MACPHSVYSVSYIFYWYMLFSCKRKLKKQKGYCRMEAVNLVKLTTSEYFMAKELKLKTYKLDNGFHMSEKDREDLHQRYNDEIEKRRRTAVAHKYLKAWK